MAFDAFIKIEGLPGEALDTEHKDWIEITGYTFGSSQQVSTTASSAGGASTGRVRLSDLSINKRLDLASAKLFEASCLGTHFKEVKLSINRAGGDKLQYFQITLEEVLISEFVNSGGDGEPYEEVRLNFGRISTTYTQQKRTDGSGGGKVTGGWDRIANKLHA